MPSVDFSEKNAMRMIHASSKSVEYFDSNITPATGQLGIRISPKDKRTWFICYRLIGGTNKQKFTLGSYPALKYKAAKEKALPLLQSVKNGKDPKAKKHKQLNDPTMTDLWKAYQDVLVLNPKKKKPATLKEESRKWEVELEPHIGKMKVSDVTPAIVAQIIDRVARSYPVAANRLRSLLIVMFKPALRKGWIVNHPLDYIDKPAQETPRQRVLTDEEIKLVWNASGTVPENAGAMLKIQLLTAQRSGEIERMRWEDIDDAVWRIKNTKTGNDHLVPLGDQVLQVLGKHLQRNSGYVFASKRGNAGHARHNTKDRSKVQEESGTSGWTNHDLRRTARTLMSRIGVRKHIAERVINHSQGGIVGVYDLHDYLQEKRQALDKLGREIDRIIGIEADAGVVIPLRRQV